MEEKDEFWWSWWELVGNLMKVRALLFSMNSVYDIDRTDLFDF